MDLTSSILVALIGICIGGAGPLAWLLYRRGEPILPPPASPRARSQRAPSPRERHAPATTQQTDTEATELERRLLRIALGDQDVVARLVAFERSHDPGAPEATLLRRAIERWQRDRR